MYLSRINFKRGMKMNYSKDFSDIILNRGYNYYKQGRVYNI